MAKSRPDHSRACGRPTSSWRPLGRKNLRQNDLGTEPCRAGRLRLLPILHWRAIFSMFSASKRAEDGSRERAAATFFRDPC